MRTFTGGLHMGKHEKERDGFKSRTGFILACIGLCRRYGEYLAISLHGIRLGWYDLSDSLYFICNIDCFYRSDRRDGARTRHCQRWTNKAFGVCTEMRTGNKKTGELIGLLPVLGSLALAIGYTVVVGWIFKYTFLALTGQVAGMKQDIEFKLEACSTVLLLLLVITFGL